MFATENFSFDSGKAHPEPCSSRTLYWIHQPCVLDINSPEELPPGLRACVLCKVQYMCKGDYRGQEKEDLIVCTTSFALSEW